MHITRDTAEIEVAATERQVHLQMVETDFELLLFVVAAARLGGVSASLRRAGRATGLAKATSKRI